MWLDEDETCQFKIKWCDICVMNLWNQHDNYDDDGKIVFGNRTNMIISVQ